MRCFICGCFALLTLWAEAQPGGFRPDTLADANPWTNTAFAERGSSFQFAVIGDLTGGYRKGVFPKAVDKANALAPEFVMSVGDLIEGYTLDTVQIQRWWQQFDGWAEGLDKPFFYVPGNHDLSNARMTRLWEERYGRTYYHFHYQNVLFLVLNTEDGAPSRISPEQAAYFRRVLAAHPEVSWTLLFLHKPLWQQGAEGFLAIEAALAGRPYTVFAGHTHRYLKQQRKGRDYYILGTTGGGSPLHGPAFGQLDHLAWVTMGPDGPKVANLTLDGILPDDIVTEESAPLAECMLKSSRFTYDPMVETQMGSQWATTLRFRNHCDEPLRIQGRFYEHSQLAPNWAQVDTVIAAGGAWAKALRLSSAEEQWGHELAPLGWDWSVRTLDEAYEQARLQPLSIAKANYCETLPTDVAIDGRWEEWGAADYQAPAELGYYPSTWQGVADCGLAARVAADEANLYLALKVQDEDTLYTPYRHSWEQEGALLELTLPDQQRIRLGFSPTDSLLVDVQENWPARGKLKTTQSGTGFVAELKLPLDHLQALYAAPVPRFRLQWIVYDHDGREDQYKGTKVYWLKRQPGGGTYILSTRKP